MKVGVFTDTHLGSILYRGVINWSKDISDVRQKDVEDSFKEAIHLFQEEKPNVVVHMGDLLEGRASADIFRIIRVAAEGLKQLLDAGIRVILMEGNHDFRSYVRDTNNQPFALLDMILAGYSNFKMVRKDTYTVDNLGHPAVFVGYHDEKNGFSRFLSTLQNAQSTLNGRRSFLFTHQTIGDRWGIPNHMPISEIPKDFVFMFNGHIHKRKLWMEEGRMFANIGSLEYQDRGEAWDVDELWKHLKLYERIFGEKDTLRMLKRMICKGVVLFSTSEVKLNHIYERGKYEKLRYDSEAPERLRRNVNEGEIPPEFWADSFYHPLRSTRPFLKAKVKDSKTFYVKLRYVLEKIKGICPKKPLLWIEGEIEEGDWNDLVSKLKALEEEGVLEATNRRNVPPLQLTNTHGMTHHFEHIVPQRVLNDVREIVAIERKLDEQGRNLKRAEREHMRKNIEDLKGKVIDWILKEWQQGGNDGV
ncbi:MAG: hypothetical protein GXO39_08640 [Thermotogae bacterium]|nr:hypothetical protein [Thermotogota bacterium]